MREGTWQEYGTPGTTTLSHDDIELAITRLEQLWDDAVSLAQPYADISSDLDGCDCLAS
jgi:hypothetical protein